MRLTGKLTVWDPQGGFGAITPDQGGDDLFVEAGDGLLDPPPLLGELLTFEVARNRDGTKRAIHVTRVSRGDAALSLSPLDTSLQARAARHVSVAPRPAPVRTPRRTGTPWSFGRMVVTVLVVCGLVLLWMRHGDRLGRIELESLNPAGLLPSQAESPAPPPAPRERLTE